MKRVAVIIPAYNAAEFLGEAIESVLAQSGCGVGEIVVVDDGSTDATAAIAASYTGVRVLSKSNGGLSSARNYGVAHTSAPYIVFLDADDMLHPRAIEALTAEAGKAPMVAGGLSAELPLPSASPVFEVMTADEAIADTLYQQSALTCSACGKLIAREVMEQAPFREGTLYEDLDWFHRAFRAAGRVASTATPLYYYRPNPRSIVHTFTTRRLDVLDVTARIEQAVAADPVLLRAARVRSLNAAFDMLRLLACAPASTPGREAALARCFDIIRSRRQEAIADSRARAVTRLASVVSLGGRGLLAALFRLVGPKQ